MEGVGAVVVASRVTTRAVYTEGHTRRQQTADRLRTYPKHQRSCVELRSRRHPRSTSLSSGSPCENLCQSHSWRSPDYSPDHQSERVHPGRPWLPVCHTRVRITSPSKEQPRLGLSPLTLPPLLHQTQLPPCSATASDPKSLTSITLTAHLTGTLQKS